MSKKSNQRMNPGLAPVRKELEAIMAKGHSGYRVYEDWVGLMFYAFQRDDPHYLELMGQYRNEGSMGRREADHFAYALACLMEYMQATNEEALGPLFEEYASSHYMGQSFTPSNMAQLMVGICQSPLPEEGRFTVLDPACGAGSCLIAAAKEQTFEQNNRAFFVGQDIDQNCVRMTALNLIFFNLDGLVIWGNSLVMDVRGAWETRRSVAFGGSIRPVGKEMARAWLVNAAPQAEAAPEPVQAPAPRVKTDTKTGRKMEQLTLF